MYGINPGDSDKAEGLVESHDGVVDENVGVDQGVAEEEAGVATNLRNHAGEGLKYCLISIGFQM